MDGNRDKSKSNRQSLISETVDFDRAICMTGYGKFNCEMTIACALSIICVGFQNGVAAYVSPAAQCELNLTSSEVGFLNVTFLFGGAISCFLWGILADNIGRKTVLSMTHLINSIVTILLITNKFSLSLTICKFINGFLIGAPGSIIFSYFAEFQPPKYRAASVCFCGVFFASAWLLLPVLAWLILPIPINYEALSFLTITPWRLFCVVIAIPEFIVALWIHRLPESPKYFVSKGDPRKAIIILRRMFSVNYGKNPEEYPVKNLISNVRIETHITDNIQCRSKSRRVLTEVLGQIKSLMTMPLLVFTILSCSIMFMNMFGIFGLGLWLPELFIRFEKYQALHPNVTVTVKQLAMVSNVKNQSCSPSFDSSVIQSTVAMGVSSLIVSAISGVAASKVSIKTIPFITMFLGGVSAGSIYWLTSSVQNLIVACIFQAAMVTANMTVGGIAVELFPTNVGGIAICLVMCAGRIGAICSNVVFGYYMDKQCEIPIFVVSVMVLIGAFLCLIVPTKTNKQKKYTDDKHNNMEISVIANDK